VPKSPAERVVEAADHPIEAACSCRPRWTTRISALCAGAGAGIGSIVGGSPLWAGVGGGTGALVGYLIVWLSVRGRGDTIAMVLALAADRLELYTLSFLRGRPKNLIRAIPYADITGVAVRERILEVGIDVATTGEPLKVDTSKKGIGAGPGFAEDLRRRIAA
jgi:hypothetical protein